MTVENLKSPPIINLDGPSSTPATPVIQNTAGEGGPYNSKEIDGQVTVSASASTTSTYRLVRVPTTVKIKSLNFEAEALTAGKFNLSVYYSDSTTDGTTAANQGLIVPTTGDQFFAADIDCSSAVNANEVNQSGNYKLDKRNTPLWKALALTSDPGGYFDIVAVCHTTAVTSAGKIGVRASYAN